MPRAPRSWTANSSIASSTSPSPCRPHAVRASIHDRTGASRRHVRPSHRRTPWLSTMRTCPFGWRWTSVAPVDSASTTRSRSEPAGRSNTAHSSSPLTRRTIQLDKPSANSRAPDRGNASTASARDGERGARLPLLHRRRRFDDRPDARDAPLVDAWPQRVVELGEHDRVDLVVQIELEADLLQLVAQPPQPCARSSHRSFRSMRSRKERRSSSVDVSTPYMAIQAVRASGWHTERSVRVTMRLPVSPSIALTSLDEPCVVMATIRRTLRKRACTRLDRGGQVEGDVLDPHPVDPPLQHGRRSAPPRRVDEHELLAPLQVAGIVGHGRVRPGFEVAGALLGAEHRVELVGVEVGDAHVVAAPRQRLDGPVAHGGDERLGVGVAMHDQGAHRHCVPRPRRPLVATRSLALARSHRERITRLFPSRASAPSSARRGRERRDARRHRACRSSTGRATSSACAPRSSSAAPSSASAGRRPGAA